MSRESSFSQHREPKDYSIEELPALRFTSAEEARIFLIGRGMLDPTYGIVEGDIVRDSRSDIPGWTLTERDTASGKIKLSQKLFDLHKSIDGKSAEELLQMAQNLRQELPPETIVMTPPEGPAEA